MNQTAKEKLTALADAVRQKTGKEGLLSLDKMTEAINELTVSSFPEGFATGQFNSENSTVRGNFTVEHGLGDIPNIVVIFRETPTELFANSVRGVIRFNIGKAFDEETDSYIPEVSFGISFFDNSAGTGITQAQDSALNYDSETVFYVPSVGTTAIYVPVYTYRWIAVKL